jgi:hypothetical protein
MKDTLARIDIEFLKEHKANDWQINWLEDRITALEYKIADKCSKCGQPVTNGKGAK